MIWMTLAAFVVMCACYVCFQRIKRTSGHSRALKIGMKCAATAMAVLVALMGALRYHTASGWLMLAGLTACMAADGVLCLRFVPGAALFALGHVLYMIAFCMMQLPTWASVAVFTGLLVIVGYGFVRFREKIGSRMQGFGAYAMVLCVMAAMAAAQKPLYFAGALLFVFSDATLCYLLLGYKNDRLDNVSLGAYYLGQFLLALGVLVG